MLNPRAQSDQRHFTTQAYKLALAFSVTGVTAEKSPSSLRHIKPRTFLRSSMTQQRLNNLFFLYVHTARTDALDLSSVVKAFVSANIRRSNYFRKC